MSTMQEFYTRLCQEAEADSPEWVSLVQLTQATVSELSALETGVDWKDW
jgi:hypothetical protein